MEYDIDSDEGLTMAIIRAVSAVDGRAPEALPPLAECIDPGALEAVFAATTGDSPPTARQLSFTYADCRITVYNGELLRLTAVQSDRQAETDGPEHTE